MNELNENLSDPMKNRLPQSFLKQLDVADTDAELEVFFDGECPLCSREIALLRRLDRKNRIIFTDIAAPEFDAARLGKTYDDMMAEIHGRLPDGNWVVGVEVFRRLYAAIGLRIPVAVSRWPGISQLLEVGYRVFAPLRLKLRPRCTAGEACRISKENTELKDRIGTSLKTGANGR